MSLENKQKELAIVIHKIICLYNHFDQYNCHQEQENTETKAAEKLNICNGTITYRIKQHKPGYYWV